MLRQKPRSSLEILGLLQRCSFQSNCCANGIAIALTAAQTECDGVTNVLHRIVQYAKLWGVAILENHFQPSVVIEIGKNKSAAVLNKIQTGGTGNLGKCSVAIVCEHHISCIAMPGVVGSNQLVDRIPSMLVGERGG